MDARTQRLELRFVGDAAEDGDRADARAFGELLDFVFHLDAEFAGGHEDQRLRVDVVADDDLQERQHVGARLARTRLGLHEHVAGGKHVGDGLLLDGHELGPAVLLQNALLFVGQHVESVVGELVLGLDDIDRRKERIYFFFLFFLYFFAHSGHKFSKWRVPR